MKTSLKLTCLALAALSFAFTPNKTSQPCAESAVSKTITASIKWKNAEINLGKLLRTSRQPSILSLPIRAIVR